MKPTPGTIAARIIHVFWDDIRDAHGCWKSMQDKTILEWCDEIIDLDSVPEWDGDEDDAEGYAKFEAEEEAEVNQIKADAVRAVRAELDARLKDVQHAMGTLFHRVTQDEYKPEK